MTPDSPQNQNGSPLGSTPLAPEDIAALLDGRLSPARRAQVLEIISSDPAHVELYADIVSVLQSLDTPELDTPELDTPALDTQSQSEPSAKTPPHPTLEPIPAAPLSSKKPSRRWQTVIPWGIAAILVVSVLWQFNRTDSNADALGTPAETVALLSPIADGVTLPPSAFVATRGGAVGLATSGIGIRVGADIAEATILADAAHGSVTPEFTAAVNRIADNLSGDPASAVAGRLFRDLSSTSNADSLTLMLRRASDAAEQFVDARQLRLGAWLTTLRFAAARRDVKFVDSQTSDAGFLTARELAPQDTTVASAAQTLQMLLAADRPDWVAIDSNAALLLRQLAR